MLTYNLFIRCLSFVLSISPSVFKAASRPLLVLILIFMDAMGLGSLLFAAIPEVGSSIGDAVCHGRVWLTCLPLAALIGIILAKNRRMCAIFGATKLEVKVHSDLDLLISVIMICTLQYILLSVFSGLSMSRSILALGHGSLSDRLVIYKKLVSFLG